MVEARHLGRLIVHFDWLAEALGLPDGAIIRGASDSRRLGAVEVKLEHESLPAVGEGFVIPEVYAVVEGGQVVGWDMGGGEPGPLDRVLRFGDRDA